MSTEPMNLSCPLPCRDYDTVLLAHGGGGTLMHELLDDVFFPALGSPNADAPHDAAVLNLGAHPLAFTTDSFVVSPYIFPGGDIGSLAVHGTVNDLAMSGATPRVLSAGFILEEGLPMATLVRVVDSMRRAAEEAGVRIVTGDTKVVERGKGDGLFINTAGIGTIEHDVVIAPGQVTPDTAVLISGDPGRHGIAIIAQREGLTFETTIESDSANVAPVVADLLSAGIRVRCLRDLTRGGLASALNEIATASGTEIAIDEKAIPLREDVRGACEMLGFDPLYVACEGRFAAFVHPDDAHRAVEIMQRHPVAANAACIGTTRETSRPVVTMTSTLGTSRIVDMLSGEQLPRIC